MKANASIGARCGLVVHVAGVLWLSCHFNNAVGDTFGRGANTFEIEFVTIGDPGNVPDLDNRPNSFRGRPDEPILVGRVNYVYRIGKHEISRGLVEKANANSDLGLTLYNMSKYGGNGPEQPATGISWFEAATYINWLNTSSGYGRAYKVASGQFQPWKPSDVGYDAENPFRNRLSHYFLPNVDEWYKAAYYNAQAGTYCEFATGCDTPPTPIASGTAALTAIYHQNATAPSMQAGGLSHYGTMAQGGNVWEWEETEYDHTNDDIVYGERGLRSGDWNDNDEHISASYRDPFYPATEDYRFGFRVASVADSKVVGDVNANGVLDSADIDMIVMNAPDRTLDLTQDGVVNGDDRSFWVHEIASTWFGDADLDGQFNSRDLVTIFRVSKYERDLTASWVEGDFDGDQDFDSGDLIEAWKDGGYDNGARHAEAALPEPANLALAALAGLSLFGFNRRRKLVGNLVTDVDDRHGHVDDQRPHR